MAIAHRELDHTVRLWRAVTAITVFVATTLLMLVLLQLWVRAERTACIDNVEVDWRIATGDGLDHLVSEDDVGLAADLESLRVVDDYLREIDAGRRC